MKSVNKYILYSCILLASSGMLACNKDLENEDKTKLNDQTQWASEGNADIFLNDVYDQLPDIYGQPESPDNFSDDNDAGFYYSSYKFKDGIIDPAATNYTLFGGAAVGVATISRYN